MEIFADGMKYRIQKRNDNIMRICADTKQWLPKELCTVICEYLFGISKYLSPNIIDQLRKYWWTHERPADKIKVGLRIGDSWNGQSLGVTTDIIIGDEELFMEIRAEFFIEMIVTGSSAGLASEILPVVLRRFPNPKRYESKIPSMVQRILTDIFDADYDIE